MIPPGRERDLWHRSAWQCSLGHGARTCKNLAPKNALLGSKRLPSEIQMSQASENVGAFIRIHVFTLIHEKYCLAEQRIVSFSYLVVLSRFMCFLEQNIILELYW
jgi:hypothetical protein